MKNLQILAVLLVLSIGISEALKCNRCVPSTPRGTCHTTVETCSRPDEVCASAVSTGIISSYFKRCMKASDAHILDSSPYYKVFTCTTDRCN
ncbi:hypothetical protein WMY93_022713 [Mugilogobius chulae]|uniref:Snake toxin/toxin-like domain-containing protein n=1 Tax=Mugilogobius chulae TaxID=88201 RepID=A0AAW0NK07_9GOBI